MPTNRRFRALWDALGAIGPYETHYVRLVELYMEPHRRYHTLSHINHCLRTVDQFRHLATQPAEVEAALWWHDAIYTPLRNGRPVSDNEERSAQLADEALKSGGVDEGRRSRIVDHILATKHTGATLVGANVTLVADIDLSILGGPWSDYEHYMAGVEREYRFDGTLDELAYVQGRATLFLQPMLDRPVIFHTSEFSHHYDVRARQNMQDELERLRNRRMYLANR